MTSTIFLLLSAWISCAFSSNYRASVEETTLTSKDEGMTVTISVSDTNDLAELTVTGPSDVYFSVAFDSCKMKNAWALVLPGTGEDDDSLVEYKLGDDKAGNELTTSFETTSDTTDDGVRTVVLSRSLSGQDDLSSDYYAFSTDGDDLDVMWAYGNKGKYSQHDESKAGCTSVSFTVTEETSNKVQAVPFSWGQLFSSDLSYFYGRSPVSLIVVLALLTSILVYAAFHCYLKTKTPGKVIVDETKPLIQIHQEDGFRIV